ncbi:MAG TPA: ATP-grasp domain-containing protein [Anaerolineales bacterium]|nr:ATP-grasp domain-containing protein [Anaerolineales bacterium]
MNLVYLSPHFPPNYVQFSQQLSYLGVNVLGLADEPYDQLPHNLKSSLAVYYRVNDMHNYDELVRALGYFTHQYGKVDRIDSLNEYWLETEACLRLDFNIPGLQGEDLARAKRKSRMKEVFRKAGVAVARGKVVQTFEEAKRLVRQTGYPLIAKPDIGVGAAKTYKIHNLTELEGFFISKPAVDYILEEFIAGKIVTFDGLTDREGNPVYVNSLVYDKGILEAVNQDEHMYYYTQRDIPADLEDAGLRVLRAFNVCERFFHFEFFRRPDNGEIVALEVNLRPPGGMTTDMWNYASDIDIYREWAHIIVHNRFTADYTRKFHVAFVGRKYRYAYATPHADLVAELGPALVHHEPIEGIFSAALGDYGYLVRSPELSEVLDMAKFIQALA